MNFYVLNKIGDGTNESPIRPNIIEGISYVCTEAGNYFLVGTNEILNDTEIADLEIFCTYNDLVYKDMLKWFVGDN